MTKIVPYRIEPFGELVIPKDWVFYTALAQRLAQANNEEALQDLCDVIVRVRRSRGARMKALLGEKVDTTLAGVEKTLRGRLDD